MGYLALAALLVASCARPLTSTEAHEVADPEAFSRQPPRGAPRELEQLFDLAMTILSEHDAHAAHARGVAITCFPHWGLEMHQVVDAGIHAASRCLARAAAQPAITEPCTAREFWLRAALAASGFNCDVHER
jgi:hypothetical protein